MKGIAIYFLFLGSALPAPAPATGTGAGKTSNVNNSALGGHRALPKVANERYGYIFFILGVGIAGTSTGNRHRRRQKILKKKKMFFLVGYQIYIYFFGHAVVPHGTARNGGPKGPIVYSMAAGARRAPSCTAQQWGPEGPQQAHRRC